MQDRGGGVSAFPFPLFYLAVSLARDRKIAQDNDWRKEQSNYLKELVDERQEIRRAILEPERKVKIIR